jgi:hypothetical protein
MPYARKGQILLCRKQSDSTKKFSEADIINMLELLIDKDRVSFFTFFLRSPCMKSVSYE